LPKNKNGGRNMTYQNIKIEVEMNVAIVKINRPPLNPLNTHVFHELLSIIDELEANKKVHAIILTGEGKKAFIAGADIHQMINLDHVGMLEMTRISRAAFSRIEKVSKPVIAAINGLALGGGLELALACDLRICSENAIFSFPEVGLGMISGGGGTQRLQRIVGQSVSKTFSHFGEIVDANRALELNIVNKVVSSNELLDVAMEWACKVAKKNCQSA
jgi:enoyl-CoA hydratase